MRRTLRILWYVLSLRCEEADRVRCLSAEGEAERYQLIAERLHSMLCRSCHHTRKQVILLDEALSEMRARVAEPAPDQGPALSDEARRHLAELAREAEGRGKSS